jgi:hypothetical protein
MKGQLKLHMPLHDIEGEIEFEDPPAPEALLTMAQVAERWGCSTRTICRLRLQRRIGSVEISNGIFRFRNADILKFEEDHHIEARPRALRGRPPRAGAA